MRLSPITTPDGRPETGCGLVLLIWVAARLLYYVVGGLPFNTEPALTFWQNVDPLLLQTDLWRSLWNLHMQPPAYNLLNGVLLKISPENFGPLCWGLHLTIGVVIAVSLYWLMRWFGVGEWWSAGLTSAFIASPACVLFESVAVYEYPIVLLLLGGTVALARFAETGGWRPLLIFGGCLLGLMLIRNLFHAGYLVLVALGLWWTLKDYRRRIALVFGPILALTLLLYLKNGVLFGRFTASTWMGMQTGFFTSHQLSAAEADQLIARRLVTPLVKIRPFSPIESYAPFRGTDPPARGIPVLDQTVTSRGYSNFNALAYLEIHDQYAANSKAILRHYPVAYLRSLLSAWFSYFLPASDLPYYFSHQPESVRQWERLFSQVVFGQIYRSSERTELVALRQAGRYGEIALYTGVVLVVLLPLLFFWGCRQVLLGGRMYPARRVVLGFVLLTIGTQAIVGNSLACCETNRYRFPMEPYFALLAGLGINDVRTRSARSLTKARS